MLYETAAWGIEDQPPFLNIALSLETSLSPEALLQLIREIEAASGRQRAVIWGQRTLDIDILFFGASVIDTAELVIPHPHLAGRRFALVPLCDIAPHFMHPVLGQTCSELLLACPDPLQVTLYQPGQGRTMAV